MFWIRARLIHEISVVVACVAEFLQEFLKQMKCIYISESVELVLKGKLMEMNVVWPPPHATA